MTSRQVVRVAFAVVAIAALVAAAVSQWSRVAGTVRAISLPALALAVVAMLAGTYVSMLAWRTILTGLGSRLPLRDATQVFFVGQLGKYLPGSVWPLLAQMELAKERGVPRRRSAAAFALVLVGSLVAAACVATVTLWQPWALVLPLAWLVLRQLDRLSPRAAAAALAWCVVQWVTMGVAVRAVGGAGLARSIGAYALAWSAGFLVLFVPAGAGVREGTLVLLLGPTLGNGEALAVALVVRLIATFADLVWGLVALPAGKRAVTVVTPETPGSR